MIKLNLAKYSNKLKPALSSVSSKPALLIQNNKKEAVILSVIAFSVLTVLLIGYIRNRQNSPSVVVTDSTMQESSSGSNNANSGANGEGSGDGEELPEPSEKPPVAEVVGRELPEPPPASVPKQPASKYANIPSNFAVASFITTDSVPPAYGTGAGISVFCNFSHLAYDDPIVFPGAVGASHLHMFVGNTGTNAGSTYESLRTTGGSTCSGGPIDRTAYWMPTMHNAEGKVVITEYVEVYYSGFGSESEIRSMNQFPNGLRMIGGYDANNSNTIKASWSCYGGGQQATVPNCPPGTEIRATLRFPMCWDGKNLDSPDHRSHMAYGTGGGGWITAQAACPPSHPIHLPEVKIVPVYVSDGNSQNWFLSSDVLNGSNLPSGSTYHADWFGAWDNDIQNTWLSECIIGFRGCNWGRLGQGGRLVEPTGYNGPRILDAPPRP